MLSHEGNQVSFEVEPTDTTVEADDTETHPQPAPAGEPELPHPSLPGGSISTCAVAASMSSDLQQLIKNGLAPPSLVHCFIFPVTPKKKTQSIRRVAKARVLTSVEQPKIFREKVEQKRVEEHKKKQMQEREKKRTEKAKSKKKERLRKREN